ncbi:phosphopantetheine-binding protein [Pseudomonas fuscovaginae UPB0736]|uniref:Acyl carrier protein n=1 Tax=Pseudomonas asplenii TaxID=53407 RepID=A0A1H6NGP2_9PSED|nr:MULTISPECIES: phosphopantetheine-binding protein [Pseudomonas]UUQ66092.1 phosphopantetheine-binding protein [Pseudomonas fuscovaginae UPB0736]UZE30683.1 phosphopantetheine-binding protein [Pseudomonas asplenii]SEI14527.1 acyl carrier protein [Pseudomonas fuscovaginae]
MSYLIPGNCEYFIEQQVMVLLASYFQLERRKVLLDSRLIEDLYLNSMGIIEVAMLLNEAFEIDLPESGVAGWRTVADVCRLVGITQQKRKVGEVDGVR